VKTSGIEKRVVKVLVSAQILNGLGTAGTVAAGSLLVSSISKSESLAGLAQTTAVLGAAAMALPLSRLTLHGGRRLALSVGYSIGVIGALFAIIGGTTRILGLMLQPGIKRDLRRSIWQMMKAVLDICRWSSGDPRWVQSLVRI
jgi:MFS family permease